MSDKSTIESLSVAQCSVGHNHSDGFAFQTRARPSLVLIEGGCGIDEATEACIETQKFASSLMTLAVVVTGFKAKLVLLKI
jgi:hypothetical protein